ELDDAARMLEMSYGLGPDGGGVDYLAARYVGSAKVKAAQGDLSAAAERLDAGMKTAENLQLPRLAAAINNERIRLGIGVAPSVAARLRSVRAIPRDDGIATIIAELDEESADRLLLASGSAAEQEQAWRRATQLLAGMDARRRPLAALRAELLLAEICSRTGRSADPTIPAVARRCRDIGLPRLLVDAGLG
ncbi:MAG: protein kinase, partial [Mycobacterium sp.]